MINISLDAHEFKHSGTYNNKKYTSLEVNRSSNGRIYLTTKRDGMRLSTMAKQMKLVNGRVYISFGPNDKQCIGTYTESND